jgi:hypothetical protein
MKLLLSITLILAVVTAAPSQRRSKRGQTREARISKKHPSIYITFVRTGKREPVYVDESDERIWLRLYNNTRSTLLLKAQGADGRVFAKGNEKEIGMFYGVEKIPETIGEIRMEGFPAKPQPVQATTKDRYEECEVPSGHWCHVCSTIELRPGKSILFSVPRDYLCRNHMLYVIYQYEWEEYVGEPEHRVYFLGNSLPKDSGAK